MGKPLPVGTDTHEPTALLYLNPLEYRVVKRILDEYQRRAALAIHERAALNRVVDSLNGEVRY